MYQGWYAHLEYYSARKKEQSADTLTVSFYIKGIRHEKKNVVRSEMPAVSCSLWPCTMTSQLCWALLSTIWHTDSLLGVGDNAQCMFSMQGRSGPSSAQLPRTPGPPMVSDACQWLPNPKAGLLTQKRVSRNLQWHQVEAVLGKSSEKPGPATP